MVKKFYKVTLESDNTPETELILASNIIVQEGCAALINDPSSEDEDFEVIAVFPLSNIKKIVIER